PPPAEGRNPRGLRRDAGEGFPPGETLPEDRDPRRLLRHVPRGRYGPRHLEPHDVLRLQGMDAEAVVRGHTRGTLPERPRKVRPRARRPSLPLRLPPKSAHRIRVQGPRRDPGFGGHRHLGDHFEVARGEGTGEGGPRQTRLRRVRDPKVTGRWLDRAEPVYVLRAARVASEGCRRIAREALPRRVRPGALFRDSRMGPVR